jgi:hypothetical protein
VTQTSASAISTSARRTRRQQVVGVVLLEADHAVETLDLEDPFGWEPPAGLAPGFFGHPAAWPVPAVFAVAKGATAAAAANGEPEAMRGVANAVARLDGRCDLIVGSCGYFAEAWGAIETPPRTPTLLSALDLLDDALRSTSRDVAVLSFSDAPAERFLATRSDAYRLRVVGISPAGDWPLIGRLDWALNPEWTMEGLERGLREVVERELRPGGRLADVGALVLECTVLPQFRRVLREYTGAPIYDVGAEAAALLS